MLGASIATGKMASHHGVEGLTEVDSVSGKIVPVSEKQHLIQTQQTHAEQTLAQLRQCKNVDLIEIDYPEMVANPGSQLDALKTFPGDAAPEPGKLTQAIRPDLHRNKNS